MKRPTLLFAVLMISLASCSTQQKLQHVRQAGLKASLAVSPRPDRSPYAIDTT